MIKRGEVVRQPERPHKQRLDRVRLLSKIVDGVLEAVAVLPYYRLVPPDFFGRYPPMYLSSRRRSRHRFFRRGRRVGLTTLRRLRCTALDLYAAKNGVPLIASVLHAASSKRAAFAGPFKTACYAIAEIVLQQ